MSADQRTYHKAENPNQFDLLVPFEPSARRI